MTIKTFSAALIAFACVASTALAQTKLYAPKASGAQSTFSAGDLRGDPGRTPFKGSIGHGEDCWINRHGFEECDFYLIWCPNEGEACVTIY